LVNFSLGYSSVLVTGIFFEEGSGVEHSLQYLESEGLSVSHLRYLITIVPFSLCGKRITIC
jgi:hypothetical protein